MIITSPLFYQMLFVQKKKNTDRSAQKREKYLRLNIVDNIIIQYIFGYTVILTQVEMYCVSSQLCNEHRGLTYFCMWRKHNFQ